MPDVPHATRAFSPPGVGSCTRSFAFATAFALAALVPPVDAQDDGAPGVDDEVVVRVDGTSITRTTLEAVVRRIERSGGEGDPDVVIEELVDLELLRAAALAGGLDRRPAVMAEVRLAETRALAAAWLAAESSRTALSDDELRAAYDDQVAGLPPEQYRASHILLETGTEARDVLARLAAGQDWDALAAARSIDASGRDGGALGWFDAVSMEEGIVSAVAVLEPGTVASEPVRTDFGFHVMRLDQRRAGARPDFSSVRPALRDIVLRARLAERLARMRDAASIEWPASSDGS